MPFLELYRYKLLVKHEGAINDLLAGCQVYIPLETTRVVGNDIKQGNNSDIKSNARQ